MQNIEYIGKIVDNEDPLNLYRIKVEIFGLFDGLDKEVLPWIFPENRGFNSVGSFPKMDSLVTVKFPYGDIYSGVYVNNLTINKELQKELKNDYENSQILVYDIDEKLRVLYTKKQGLILDLDGDLINIKDKKIILESSSEIKINAPKVTVNGDHFVRWEEFQIMFDAHIHTGNMGVPTSPPLPPNTVMLKPKTKTTLM